MMEALQNAFDEGLKLWKGGGWAMIPLAINALILYAIAAQIRLTLWGKSMASVLRRTAVTPQPLNR